MSSEPLLLVDDPARGVRRLRLNRFEKRNALNNALNNALRGALFASVVLPCRIGEHQRAAFRELLGSRARD